MTEESIPTGQSTQQQGSESAPEGGKKKRGGAEKLIIWGVILVLGGLAGWEAIINFGHQKSVAAIDAYIKESCPIPDIEGTDEYLALVNKKLEESAHLTGMDRVTQKDAEDETLDELTRAFIDREMKVQLSNVEALMSGFPKKTIKDGGEGPSVAIYHWGSRWRQYGGLRVRHQGETGKYLSHTDYAGAADL